MTDTAPDVAALPLDFWAKVDLRPGECWPWTGPVSTNGYGRYRRQQAHRLTYEFFIGPIPDGLELDHLCRVRNCVSPLHLEPVTHRENTLRGETLPAAQLARGTCPYGHAYDPRGKDGHRWCRTCHNDRRRKGTRP